MSSLKKVEHKWVSHEVFFWRSLLLTPMSLSLSLLAVTQLIGFLCLVQTGIYFLSMVYFDLL